jgi:multidrug efflux pump subunit AcrB
VTLASAVILSMVVALLLVPLAAARLPARPPRPPSRLDAAYGRLLRRVMRHRVTLVTAALGLVVLGVVAQQNVRTGFLPAIDEGGFVLDYFLPAGTSLQDTAATAARLEAVLATDPDVVTWTRRTGAELGPAAATEVSRGDILVRLKPASERTRSAWDVIDALRPRVEEEVPEARTEFILVLQDTLNDLAGAPHPIEVKLFGPDPQRLEALAGEIAPRIEPVPGLADFYGGVEAASPALRFDVDPEAAGRLGLTPGDVVTLLNVSVRGRIAATVPYEDRLIDVRVRAPDEVRYHPDRLETLPLVPALATAPVTTLQAVARATDVPTPTVLRREDLRPVVVISAEQEERDLGSIMTDVRAALAEVRLPAGYTLELGGTYAEQQATFADLMRVLTLAVFAVALVLVAQFRSLRLAIVVLVTAPIALVGALVTLWVTGVPLDVSSLMGLVLLVGLVVKNGVLLLEHAQEREAEGVPRAEAVVEAGERRIRPILLTTICTLFGLLPLALGIGQGTDLQRPLAVAVIGGLSLSTLVSLFLVPALAAGRGRAA